MKDVSPSSRPEKTSGGPSAKKIKFTWKRALGLMVGSAVIFTSLLYLAAVLDAPKGRDVKFFFIKSTPKQSQQEQPARVQQPPSALPQEEEQAAPSQHFVREQYPIVPEGAQLENGPVEGVKPTETEPEASDVEDAAKVEPGIEFNPESFTYRPEREENQLGIDRRLGQPQDPQGGSRTRTSRPSRAASITQKPGSNAGGAKKPDVSGSTSTTSQSEFKKPFNRNSSLKQGGGSSGQFGKGSGTSIGVGNVPLQTGASSSGSGVSSAGNSVGTASTDVGAGVVKALPEVGSGRGTETTPKGGSVQPNQSQGGENTVGGSKSGDGVRAETGNTTQPQQTPTQDTASTKESESSDVTKVSRAEFIKKCVEMQKSALGENADKKDTLEICNRKADLAPYVIQNE